MPVLLLHCPDCGHEFRSLVMPGTRVPAVWSCSVCKGRQVHPHGTADAAGHPWAAEPGEPAPPGCACCG